MHRLNWPLVCLEKKGKTERFIRAEKSIKVMKGSSLAFLMLEGAGELLASGHGYYGKLALRKYSAVPLRVVKRKKHSIQDKAG